MPASGLGVSLCAPGMSVILSCRASICSVSSSALFAFRFSFTPGASPFVNSTPACSRARRPWSGFGRPGYNTPAPKLAGGTCAAPEPAAALDITDAALLVPNSPDFLGSTEREALRHICDFADVLQLDEHAFLLVPASPALL